MEVHPHYFNNYIINCIHYTILHSIQLQTSNISLIHQVCEQRFVSMIRNSLIVDILCTYSFFNNILRT